MESEAKRLYDFVLTCFFHANRYPLRSKTLQPCPTAPVAHRRDQRRRVLHRRERWASMSFVLALRIRPLRGSGLIGAAAGLRFSPLEVFTQRCAQPHLAPRMSSVAIRVRFVDHGVPCLGVRNARSRSAEAGGMTTATYTPAPLPQQGRRSGLFREPRLALARLPALWQGSARLAGL
jgi:hypothetical protein